MNWRTRNYVGTLFGGSMFAAVDPIYMVMWLKVLPEEFRIWVKKGEIDFRRPGRETLYAGFLITDAELSSITAALDAAGSCQRDVEIPLTTASGDTCAVVGQVLHFRRR